VDELLDGLAAFLSHAIRADSPRELVAHITSLNTVVLTMMREVLAARNRKAAEFSAVGPAAQLEYLPWTAMRREQLMQLGKLSLQYGLPAVESGPQRTCLLQQVQHRLNMELEISELQFWAPCHVMCTAVLIG
jgi:hypothetical protein